MELFPGLCCWKWWAGEGQWRKGDSEGMEPVEFLRGCQLVAEACCLECTQICSFKGMPAWTVLNEVSRLEKGHPEGALALQEVLYQSYH